MEWITVPVTICSVVLTFLMYNNIKKECDTYVLPKSNFAFRKGLAYGVGLGVAATLTSSMVIDTIVQLVK